MACTTSSSPAPSVAIGRLDGLLERLGPVRPGEQLPDPVAFFCQVRELEVAREGPRHLLGAMGVEGIHDLEDRAPSSEAGRPPERDRRAPQTLDVLEELRAFGLDEDLPEDRR